MLIWESLLPCLLQRLPKRIWTLWLPWLKLNLLSGPNFPCLWQAGLILLRWSFCPSVCKWLLICLPPYLNHFLKPWTRYLSPLFGPPIGGNLNSPLCSALRLMLAWHSLTCIIIIWLGSYTIWQTGWDRLRWRWLSHISPMSLKSNICW